MGARQAVRHWWTGHPDVLRCPHYGCPIQATSTGTSQDGMTQHLETMHLRARGGAL